MARRATAGKITEEGIHLIAARFKALGEPGRLKLLMLLMNGEKAVGELVEASKMGQANVSRQLQVLLGAGILERRKKGLNVYYSIADESIPELCNLMCGSLRSHIEGQSRALE